MSAERGWVLIKSLRDPSFWISVTATLISVVTFLIVTANPGHLSVFLADRIGVTIQNNQLRLLVPFVVTNTGASRTQRHVLFVTISLRQTTPNVQNTEMMWIEEYQFLSKFQYVAKYGTQSETAGQPQQPLPAKLPPMLFEQLDYINHAVPFALWGGNSISKIMMFDEKRPVFKGDDLEEFEIVLSVTTEARQFTGQSTYRCAEKISHADWLYCRDVVAWK